MNWIDILNVLPNFLIKALIEINKEVTRKRLNLADLLESAERTTRENERKAAELLAKLGAK